MFFVGLLVFLRHPTWISFSSWSFCFAFHGVACDFTYPFISAGSVLLGLAAFSRRSGGPYLRQVVDLDALLAGSFSFVIGLLFWVAVVADAAAISIPLRLTAYYRGLTFSSACTSWSTFTVVLFLRISLCLFFCFVLG